MNILLFLTPKNDVAYLYEDFTLRQALEKMEFHRYSAIPVLDREGRYVGTITEGDLLWEIKNRRSLDMRRAEGVPLTQIPRRTCNEPVRVDTTMEMLIEKALNQNFVPVVDDRGCFIGLVKRKEIIRYCYERMQDCPAGFATRLEKEGPATQELSFRIATEEDIPLILYYIKQLADYEQLGQEVTATEEVLREYLFRQRRAEVLIGEIEGQPVGYALFFHNFSTILGRAGIYLEDLYVHPAYRGKGYGRLFLRRLAQIALERQCVRLEWASLDWNEAAGRFYKALGARPMEGWITYRLDGEALARLAE